MRKACKRLSLDAKNLSLFSSTVLIFSGIFILTCFIIAKLLQLSGSILRSNYWNTSPVNPNHIFELRETSQNLLWISQTTTQSIHPKEGMDMVSVLTKMFPAPQGGSFLLEVLSGQAPWKVSSIDMPCILSKMYLYFLKEIKIQKFYLTKQIIILMSHTISGLP